MSTDSIQPNPKTDIVFERVVDVPAEKLYKGWTTPKLMEDWFCPKPWRATDFKLELKPGGAFDCVMKGPNGESFPNEGCFLELVPNKKLVFTGLMKEGFRPVNSAGGPVFTCVLTFTPQGNGTLYRAVAMHPTEESCNAHKNMGFIEGWGKALDQLVELSKKM